MGRYAKKQLAEFVYSEDSQLRMKAAKNGIGLDILVMSNTSKHTPIIWRS